MEHGRTLHWERLTLRKYEMRSGRLEEGVEGSSFDGEVSSLVFRDVKNDIAGVWICLGSKLKQANWLENTVKLILGMTTHQISLRTSSTLMPPST